MSLPNAFLIQRKTLARFRNKIPFLAFIPDDIYHTLSPSEWYEPFGEIEQARQELEEQLHCYVMLYKRYRPLIPWEKQLCVYIKDAHLTPKKQSILHAYNDAVWELGIECEAYQKPLQMRTPPLEHPFAHCEPPEADEEKGFAGIETDDIPF
jgi:hypothetical protein